MSDPKFCETCGRRASADARFCGGCGRTFEDDPAGDAAGGANRPATPRAPAAVGAPAAPGSRPVAPVPAAPATPPVAASRAGPPFSGDADAPEETVFELRGRVVRSLGEAALVVLTLGIVWVWLWVVRRTVRYRITTQRIEIITGLFTVTRRTTDLFRIQDLEVVEPFWLRMRGSGNLIVRAQDAGEPVLTLVAIPDVRTVRERLRALVTAERRRQGVRVFEEGR